MSILFLFLLLVSPAQSAYDTQLYVHKGIYAPGENITLKGYVYNSSNYSLGFNASVTVAIFNSSGLVSNVTFNATNDGLFYSKSDYYPNATAVNVPSEPGRYIVNATYTDPAGVSWSTHSNVTVIPATANRVDEIEIMPGQTTYYAGTNVSVTAGAYMKSGGQKIAVPNVTVNATMRAANDSIARTFNCTTGSDGTCTMSTVAAPSTSGTYVLEANDYVGYAAFKVRPFELLTTMKDSTGAVMKSVFATGEDAYAEATVLYNSTRPTDGSNYTITGYIADVNGTPIYTLPGILLTSSNSYLGRSSFRINSSFGTGTFSARLTAAKVGGESINESATFQIKNWEVSVSKATTESGFASGYSAFGNRTVQFEMVPTDRTTGSVVSDLNTTTNVTITVNNELALPVANTTATYNSTCSCYKFNLTSPTVTGNYVVKVSVDKGGETQTSYSTIKVVTITASATPSDAVGTFKEMFGTGEFVYITPSLTNTSTSVNVTDAELISLLGPDGAMNYTNASSWNAMNVSDSTFQWSFNSTLGKMRLDPPRTGGQYLLKIYVNNRSATAEVKFTMKPYGICMSPKATSEVTTSSSDFYKQFKTTDTIYMHIGIKRASDSTVKSTQEGSSSMGGTAGGYGGGGMGYMYGMGQMCTINTQSEQPITNASLAVLKVINIESGREESINTTASTCQVLSTSGTYLCTLKPNNTAWEGGMHAVTVSITGPDGTKDTGYGGFEARNFYIQGWSSTWMNKPESNITIQIYMYTAGSGWFSNGRGLSGTASLEKIEYLGKPGMWMWSSSNYDYNTTGIGSITITNGAGTMVLNASRAPGKQWSSGSYTAVFKGIDEQGNADYGRVWFEIRKWDAFAQAVEIQGESFRSKYDIGTKENVSLYVKISNAGDDWMSSGNSLGGDVNIRVKKIEYAVSWPPRELAASEYAAGSITVSTSNRDMWSANASNSSQAGYIISINSTTGRWAAGNYMLMLDLNGTEVGHGWFNVISFGVNAQPVSANGPSAYASKGQGPIYFNVTATKSTMWSGYYTANDYVNATIDDLSIYTWGEDSNTGQWGQREFNYPEDLNFSIVSDPDGDFNFVGTAMINVTYLVNNQPANWPSGWYSGQLTLKNNESDTATGWLGFNIQAFRIDTSQSTWEVPMSAVVNVTISIKEPDYGSQAALSGNYSIYSVVEETWGMGFGGPTRTAIANYTPTNIIQNETVTSTTLQITPNGGSWAPGWKSLKIYVNDTNTSSIQEAYVSFNAMAFKVTLTRTSNYDISVSSNVNATIALTDPGTGAAETGNLTSVFAWGWPDRTTYHFIVDNDCNSETSPTGCSITGTKNVTILAPSGGWEEKYHELNFEYSASGQKVEDWQRIYFNARPTITAYTSMVDDYFTYRYDGFGQNENVTLYIQNIQDLNGNSLTVNVTNVEYALSSPSCWEDSCRTYQNASWLVVSPTGNSTSNEITGWGYARMRFPSGGWPYGQYYARVTLQKDAETAVIRNAWFNIVDRTPMSVVISSPAMGQNVNSSTISISATTSKNSNCHLNVINFDSFISWYCSYAPLGMSLPASCTNTAGYNGTQYYSMWIDSYNTPGYTTGALRHAYNYSVPADMPNGQHYVIQLMCCDSNWMCTPNTTVFYLNKSAGSIIPLWSQNSVNTTTAGATAGFYLYFRDLVGLSGYIFSTNNSGEWVNDSWAAFPEANVTSATMMVSKVLPSAPNTTLWAVYFSNTLGNWNSTPNFTVTVTPNSAPKWSLNTTSMTAAGAMTTFSVNWTDTSQLSGYIFETNNTGQWVNDTWRPFYYGGTVSLNVTRLNSTPDTHVQWRVYANNSLNNWNATDLFNLNTISTNPQWQISTAITNTTVAGAPVRFTLNWSDQTGLDGYIFSTNNSGEWLNDSWRPFTGTFSFNVTTLNPTPDTIVEWAVYANNSLNQWNSTLNFSLTTASNTIAPKWVDYSQYLGGAQGRAGQATTFNVLWQDPAGIAGYIFSTNNSGSWQNDSWMPLFGNTTSVYTTANKTLNTSYPVPVSWRFYANNTMGLWNSTLNFSFIRWGP